MPYLPGSAIVDASGNPLLDLADAILGEPAFDMSGLVTWVQTLYDSVVGTGHGDFWQGVSRIFLSVYTGNPDWLVFGYTDPDVTDSFSRIGFLYNWLEPGASDPASLRTFISAAAELVRTDAASPHLPTIEDVLTALDAGVNVNLPETPPAGYGGSTAEQIWGYYLNGLLGGIWTADAALSAAFLGQYHKLLYGKERIGQHRDFQVDYTTWAGGHWPTSFAGVTCDYTDIEADDTVLSWLQRTDTSGRVWALDSVSNLAYSLTNLAGEYHDRITCTLTDADLQAIRAGYAAGSAVAGNVPPVWPGLAAVSLGSSVPLASSVTLTGPLHGVLVAVTTPPAGLGLKNIGGNNYWYRLGEITFESDNGDLEPPQYLGFESALYTPKSMTEATAAYLRVMGAAAGTATPYTITT